MPTDNPAYYEVKGTTEIIQQPDRRRWTPSDGVISEKVFIGYADAVRAKFNELAALGIDSSVDEMSESINGVSGQLICRIADDSGGEAGGNTENLNAYWELIANDLLKPIESAYYFRELKATSKRVIERAARDAIRLEEFKKEDGTLYYTSIVPDLDKKLYAYLANNMLDYLSFDLILRKTTRLSSRNAITASYAGINTVVANSSEDMTIIINPPTRLLGVLTSLPRIGQTDGAWEWLKKAPQIKQLARQSYELVYEWHGAENWAVIPYGGKWDPNYDT